MTLNNQTRNVANQPALISESMVHDSEVSLDCRWFVAYTKPREEEVAREHLQRQGFEIYLPRLQITKRQKSQLVVRVEALFPRYLFISLDLERDDWAPIRSTRGMCGLVRFDGKPKAVPLSFIHFLHSNEDTKPLQIVNRETWKLGEKVEIEQGLFAGYSCIFQKQRSADRVAVLLNLVGTQTKATINKQDLKIPQYA